MAYQTKNTTTWKNQIAYGKGLTWGNCVFTWAEMTMTWDSLIATSWTDLTKNTTTFNYQSKS